MRKVGEEDKEKGEKKSGGEVRGTGVEARSKKRRRGIEKKI